jgi:tripartite-type tricarboxylate transporter receptor subunit TctC
LRNPATIPTGLEVNPRLPMRSVAELIAFAKPSPGRITAATQGKGTTSHLTSEWFQIAAGVKFVHVPYRGSAPKPPSRNALFDIGLDISHSK